MKDQGPKIDTFFIALSRYKRQKYDESIEMCTSLLEKNPYDQAAWLLKCRALTKKNWIDDLEIEEEGIADLLMDENAVAANPRPGTSFDKPLQSSHGSGGISQMIRPISNSGRPISGFARPGTNRPITGNKNVLKTALSGFRPTTASNFRPITSGGRFLRLGTASMIQQGNQFIIAEKINAKNTSKVKAIARCVCDYLIYVENNPRKALEIATESSSNEKQTDWFWKARLGKCYFKLGLMRDAEKLFTSSLHDCDILTTHLELAKVAIKLDQPGRALDIYSKALNDYPNEIHFNLGMARIHDMLNDPGKSIQFYKKVLEFESSNIESLASIASYHFYTDQPEIALRFYKRLVQLGVSNAELWNNLALCCFFAGQYDITLSCFEKALALADDTNTADIWYNIGQIGINIGDAGMAHQAFKNAISSDPNHSESFNNLGVLELRKGDVEQARSNFERSSRNGQFLFEPAYNAALLAFKTGEYQESYNQVKKALEIFPEHADSKELLKNLKQHFSLI